MIDALIVDSVSTTSRENVLQTTPLVSGGRKKNANGVMLQKHDVLKFKKEKDGFKNDCKKTNN